MKKIRKLFGVYHHVMFLNRLLPRYVKRYTDRKYLTDGRRALKKAGLLDTRNLSENYLEEIKRNWKKHYGRTVDPLWHIAIANYTGKEDWRYIPQNLWFTEVLPCFNNMSMRPAYLDKNLADILMNINMRMPETVVKRMHGRYYTADNTWLPASDACQLIQNETEDMIIKSSQTDNGVNIKLLQSDGRDLYVSGEKIGFEQLEHKFGKDYLVQHKIRQHRIMAEPHPASVNTVRLVTFRHKDKIQVIISYARFGAGNNITDNGATGGLACGIDERGRLKSFAVSKQNKRCEYHPTTSYYFGKCEVIPSFDSLCAHALEMHKQLFHFDLVSWDFVIDEGGEPIFLEVNYRGACFRSQLVTEKPFFGELTEEVLNILKKNKLQGNKGKNYTV